MTGGDGAKMDYKGFLQEINGGLRTAYVFQGTEEYLKHKALVALRDQLNPALFEMNYAELDNPPAQEILDACETLPAFDKMRLVVVRGSRLFDAGKGEKELQRVCDYIGSRNDGGLCLVFYEKDKPDGRKAGAKAIYRVAQAVDFLQVDDYGAAEFVFRQAALLGLRISMQDARYLVERAGRDLSRLENELEKLAVMGEEAGRGEIDLYVSPDIESNVFRMMDAFEAGKPREGYEILRFLLQNGERAPAIIGALAARFRLVLQAQELYAQKRGAQAYELMGKSFAARRAIEDRGKHTGEWLKSALRLLTELDFACKTGKIREAEGLEALLAKLYGERGQRKHGGR